MSFLQNYRFSRSFYGVEKPLPFPKLGVLKLTQIISDLYIKQQDKPVKKTLYIILLLFISLPLFSFGSREKKTEHSEFKKAVRLWNNKNIDSYKMKILYKRGNYPDSEIIISITQDGIKLLSENNEKFSKEFIQSLSADGLFTKMENSLNNKKKSPFILKAEYNSNFGFIKMLSRVPSEEALKKGGAPRDAGYRIEILDFIPEEIK